MDVQEKFAATRSELSACLIEREAEVDMVLTAMAAGEHALLVGPPGTAKSMLCDAIVGWMGGSKFSILLTKYTTPEEVFGPVSLAGLKQDVYRRVTTGKMPEADVAFIDEIWKASSAILNTMLKILNERTFQNNGTLVQCPLKLCVAASNEWPGDYEGGKELGALFDRFVLRKSVKPIASEEGRERLLWGDVEVKLSTTITPAELETSTQEIELVKFDVIAKEALSVILDKAKAEGVMPGDRRMRKAVKVAKAYAWLCGSSVVEKDHLEILQHVLWDDPAEQPDVLAKIVAKVANPEKAKINSLLMEADQIVKTCNQHDTGEIIAACQKLKEIHGKLADLSGSLASKAADHVKSHHSKLMIASIG